MLVCLSLHGRRGALWRGAASVCRFSYADKLFVCVYLTVMRTVSVMCALNEPAVDPVEQRLSIGHGKRMFTFHLHIAG